MDGRRFAEQTMTRSWRNWQTDPATNRKTYLKVDSFNFAITQVIW
jgi:hypothetical protein